MREGLPLLAWWCIVLAVTDKVEPPKDAPTDSSARAPYQTPTLRVFGTITAITSQLNRDGRARDGGPNNFKT